MFEAETMPLWVVSAELPFAHVVIPALASVLDATWCVRVEQLVELGSVLGTAVQTLCIFVGRSRKQTGAPQMISQKYSRGPSSNPGSYEIQLQTLHVNYCLFRCLFRAAY